MASLVKLGDILKCRLSAIDGEIGRMKDVYFDDASWTVRYFVARVSRWPLGKKALIDAKSACDIDEAAQVLQVDLTVQQVEDSPPLDEATPVSRHYEAELFRHYGLKPYWGDPMLLRPVLPGPDGPAPTAEPREPESPHLRSSEEISGYRVHATDGEIGHVADLILESRDWTLRYLEIDTRNWLPGKHVLLEVGSVTGIDWAAHEVRVDMPRQRIWKAPPYHPSQAVTRDYQAALARYYHEVRPRG